MATEQALQHIVQHHPEIRLRLLLPSAGDEHQLPDWLRSSAECVSCWLPRRLPARSFASQLTGSLRLGASQAVWGPGFVLPWNLRSRLGVITFYDFIWDSDPARRSPALRWFAWRLRESARRADKVIVISRTVAQQLQQRYDVAPNKIEIGYPLPDRRFAARLEPRALQALLARRGLRPGSYFLSVGGLAPRKNHARLLQAYAAHRTQVPEPRELVVVGNPLGPESEPIRQLLSTPAPGVSWLQGVDSDELAALYQGSGGVVFPSLDEGYGIPLVEAFESGSPVVCSHLTVFQEVAGQAACYFDPHDVASLAHALTSLTPGRAENLRGLGQQQAQSLRQSSLGATLVRCVLAT